MRIRVYEDSSAINGFAARLRIFIRVLGWPPWDGPPLSNKLWQRDERHETTWNIQTTDEKFGREQQTRAKKLSSAFRSRVSAQPLGGSGPRSAAAAAGAGGKPCYVIVRY